MTFNTGGVYCTKTISSSSWINATSGVVLAANSQDSCNKYTIPGYINSCCPIGLTCNASANSEAGKCISAPVDVYRVCSDYKDSLSCINDDQKLGNKSIGSNITCGIGPLYSIGTDICVDKTDCGCIWNSTRNVCQALTNYTQNCKLGGSKNRGLCIWGSSTLENNCNNSLANMILRSVANWKGGILNDTQTAIEEANCKNEVRTLSCPSVAKLPFMNETSLVIIIIVLLIVYILINRTNRKSKNKDTFKYKSNKKKKI
ncbi:hypothetical protein FJZ17_03930 [Candidatus Pacearchaeota archaeon]|nr:hypothetical protein [Candidatus Pacearchaeota archaeon]